MEQSTSTSSSNAPDVIGQDPAGAFLAKRWAEDDSCRGMQQGLFSGAIEQHEFNA